MMKKCFGLTLILALLFGTILLAGEEDKGTSTNDAAGLIEQCKQLLKKNEVDKAIELAQKAVLLSKDNSDSQYWLAMAYQAKAMPLGPGMEKLEITKKYLKTIEKSVALDANNTMARVQLATFLSQAPPIVGGDIEKAKIHAAEIVKNNRLQGNLILANIHMKENKWDETATKIKKAYEAHLELKKKDPNKNTGFNINVSNLYGYHLLKEKKYDEAIKIFKMNAGIYPENFNPWDSLGETYLLKGDKKLALEHYEKALKMNPNQNPFEKRAYQIELDTINKLKAELKK
jgi:tetratricopeptide (TPR) repeat protein